MGNCGSASNSADDLKGNIQRGQRVKIGMSNEGLDSGILLRVNLYLRVRDCDEETKTGGSKTKLTYKVTYCAQEHQWSEHCVTDVHKS